jgi:hypothetical protein
MPNLKMYYSIPRNILHILPHLIAWLELLLLLLLLLVTFNDDFYYLVLFIIAFTRV